MTLGRMAHHEQAVACSSVLKGMVYAAMGDAVELASSGIWSAIIGRATWCTGDI